MQGQVTKFVQWIARLLVCVSVFVYAHLGLFAQDSPANTPAPSDTNSTKKETPKAGGKSTPESGLPPANVRILADKDGNPRAVPVGATWEKFLEFIKDEQNKATAPADATVTEVKITGTADDDRATLKVAFTVLVLNTDQWVRTQLFLNEALLLSYTGEGEHAPDFRGDPEKGYFWWFRGKGQHRLEMQVSVPLKKQLPSRNLVLTIPQSPISGAVLTLPFSSVNAKVFPKQTILDVKPSGDKKSIVEVRGITNRLDLTWQPTSELRPNDVSLESQTIISAQVEADHALLRAEQQIRSLQGQFDQVVVRLPTGAELLKLEDTEKLSYKFDPENRQRVIVSLKEKTNSAPLNWTLRLDAKSRSFTIDGFFIEGARKQVGKIGLSIAEGMRLSDKRDPTLISINAGEFPSGMGPVVRAYQFLNQPFKLATSFDEVKPFFRVEPKLRLSASTQVLDLDGEFELHVDRDTLNEVVLSWPNYKAEGWTIGMEDEPGIVERFSVDDHDQITAHLLKPRAGSFSIHIRAHRYFKPGEEIQFTVPRPKSASRLAPTTLTLINAENVETDLTGRGETSFHLLPSSSQNGMAADTTRGLRTTTYRVDTEDEQSFGLRVIPQKQRVRTESFTEAKWQDNQFRFVQHLIYDVSYERLSQIRVLVPDTIDIKRTYFYTSNNVEITPELLPINNGPGRLIQLKLSEPQLGRFEILAKFSAPFAKELLDTDRQVSLPIVSSVDQPFSRTRVSLAQSDRFDAEPTNPDTWRPQLNRQESMEWMADGEQLELPLKLVRSTHSTETGSVSRALVQMYIDENGDAAIRAQFRLTTRASSLHVHLPLLAKSPVFYWDRNRIVPREENDSPGDALRYQLSLPEKAEGASMLEHLLTIDYQDSIGAPMSWSDSLTLRSPQLPSCSWDQVIWKVVLPEGQHILTYPATASPMFRWQRSGIFWSRVSDPNSEHLQEWVTAGAMELPPASNSLVSEKNGNLYSFSQFNSPKPLTFQTLNSPMILLFGAGFSLVAGFVILRVTLLRHVLTLLLLGVMIAIAGLWYAAPLELLLQPMIAGLFFPITAVALESWIRRSYDTAGISFGTQGEFPPLQAFGSPYVVRQTDPNEATLHRPAPRDSDVNVAVESGSGVS